MCVCVWGGVYAFSRVSLKERVGRGGGMGVLCNLLPHQPLFTAQSQPQRLVYKKCLVPCEQVHCRDATGVWLKHIINTVNHKNKTYNLKAFYTLK